MILYYFPISQITENKTVSDFYRGVYACICICRLCTYFTTFLFNGLTPVYPDASMVEYMKCYTKYMILIALL